jgi:hypothetical protein
MIRLVFLALLSTFLALPACSSFICQEATPILTGSRTGKAKMEMVCDGNVVTTINANHISDPQWQCEECPKCEAPK